MSMRTSSFDEIYGIYDLTNMETFDGDKRTSEEALGGVFVFRRDHKLSVFSASNEMTMSYTGKFQVKDQTLLIETIACSNRENEGKTLARSILGFDGETLILEARSSNSPGLRSVITWKKVVSL
jgi:hypothetical protein